MGTVVPGVGAAGCISAPVARVFFGIVGVLLLTSKGAAGVTGSGFITLTATLASTGLRHFGAAVVKGASAGCRLGVGPHGGRADRFDARNESPGQRPGLHPATTVNSEMRPVVNVVALSH